MLGADLVQQMMARRERGDGVKRIEREFGVDRKTIKRWLRLGNWQPRQARLLSKPIDRFAEFHRAARARGRPEWCGAPSRTPRVGFEGTYQQVQRFPKPQRARRSW